MKNLVMIMLVALCATSSLTADTLSIVSHRVVDMCSSEKTWLVSVGIGEVYFSDSLMSFDIAIGYDTAKVRPTSGLVQGTLSEYMKYGDFSPFFNFRVPGQITAGGFTISTPVKGNRPIVAIVGDFVDSCSSFDTLFFPYEAEFNSEFKRTVTEYKNGTVVNVRVPRLDTKQGVWFRTDSISVTGKDSIQRTSLLVNPSGLLSGSLRIDLELTGDSNFEFESFTSLSSGMIVDSIVKVKDSNKVMLFCTVTTKDEVEVLFEVVSKTNLESSANLSAKVFYRGDCECINPGQIGTLHIQSKEVLSSIGDEDVDDSFVIAYDGFNEIVTIQNDHGHLMRVKVYNVFGLVVEEILVESNSVVNVDIQKLVAGLYFVNCTIGSKKIVKKILK